MRKLYFDLDNGKVERPRDITAPAYYALLDDNNQIKELWSCFSKFKLDSYPIDWREDMIKCDHDSWTNYAWLMKNLSYYIQMYEHLIPKQNYEEEYKDQYIYLKFWEK